VISREGRMHARPFTDRAARYIPQSLGKRSIDVIK